MYENIVIPVPANRARAGLVLAVFCTSSLVACLETRPPPDPIHQVHVSRGPTRLFLQDLATDFKSLGKNERKAFVCREFASDTATATKDKMRNDEPYNCFIDVISAELDVDVVETTNDLYQLCFDSKACRQPDPYNQADYCADRDRFGECPVVNVSQLAAREFCEFVGGRLPSAIEQVIMRQTKTVKFESDTATVSNRPIAPPADYEFFPGSSEAPTSCQQGKLLNCLPQSPAPAEIAAKMTRGEAKQDKVNDIYDLTGNLTEWALDLLPAGRESNAELPWFCERPMTSPCVAAQGCAYVMGVTENNPIPHRICIAASDLKITNGLIGITTGGNYKESPASDVKRTGIFSQVIQPSPNALPVQGILGFRCVSNNSEVIPLLVQTATITPSPDAGLMLDASSIDAGVMDVGTSSDAAVTDDVGTTSSDAAAIMDAPDSNTSMDAEMIPDTGDSGVGTTSDAETPDI